MSKQKPTTNVLVYFTLFILSAIVILSCTPSSAKSENAAFVQSLPVVAIKQMPATVFQEYSASLEGSKDIEIRPQVDGYIEKIYVDEGAKVQKVPRRAGRHPHHPHGGKNPANRGN